MRKKTYPKYKYQTSKGGYRWRVVHIKHGRYGLDKLISVKGRKVNILDKLR